MSTPPPRSQVEPKRFSFKTPERDTSFVYDGQKTTPSNRGTSSRKRQEGDTDRVEGYQRDDYDDYVRQDLNSRVFVDFEVFLKSALHVPHDWKSQWGPTIEAVKSDEKFAGHYKEYCDRCEEHSTLEYPFYQPLMKTANAVLDVVSKSTVDDFSGTPQYYHVNNPKSLRGGVINKVNLTPDLVVLHKDCPLPTASVPPKDGQPLKNSNSIDGRTKNSKAKRNSKSKCTAPGDTKPEGAQPEDTKPKDTKPSDRLHWANALHILEVKPYDNTICDGQHIPRLIVDGIDPISNHAPIPQPKRYKSSEPAPVPPTTSTTGSRSTTTRKRRPDGSHASSQPASKRARTKSTTKPTVVRVGEGDGGSSMLPPETKAQTNPAVQIGSYLLEMFSVPLIRSHATVCLVDRDRLQLYHANRSVILVSSAIKLSDGDGLDKFIAVVIAFHCLSLDKNGILDTFAKDNVKLVKNPNISSDNKAIQKGSQLVITEDGSQEKITVTLGDLISRDPATIGRSTAVLKATSDSWPDINLVVKVSWPTVGRVPESDFLKKATEEAKKTKEKWATKHLPRMFLAKDVDFGEDSTFKSVANLFENAEFKGGDFVYERRTLRIIIQEELYPLKLLKDVKEIGQVFVDIAGIHRWLHDHPGILHRDLSLNNIMCRIIEELNREGKQERRVYGVLTDYDLSSWTKDLKNDYTKTSQQRTGTPPYMAKELLEGTSATHLYRHDLESLFYIMLLTLTRHTVGHTQDKSANGPLRTVMLGGRPPYQHWFDEQNYEVLGGHKAAFFSSKAPLQLPEHFADFGWWLLSIKSLFGKGFWADVVRSNAMEAQLYHGSSADEIDPFDDETLGGYVTYPSFIEPVRGLKGKLEGLVIRYNPETVPLTPADEGDLS